MDKLDWVFIDNRRGFVNLDKKMISALMVILVIISSLLGATGMLFFKLGSKKISFKIKDWVTNWRVILGLVLYATATITLISALKIGDLSIVYPMYAFSYLWVALLSQTLLKEKISLLNWVGVFLIIGGIALTTIR